MTVTVKSGDDGPIVEAHADTLHDAYTQALQKIWANYGTAVKLHTQETMEPQTDYTDGKIIIGAYVRIRVEFPVERT
jgi:hypothetical protein